MNFILLNETMGWLQNPFIMNGITVVITVIGSALLAYRYGLKRLKRETPILIKRELFNKRLTAFQACWKLLKFTTDNENINSVLVYEEKENGAKDFYFFKKNAEQFRQELSDLFYAEGWGIYLPQPLKSLLFEYDNIVFGMLLSTKEDTDTRIKIRNKEMAGRMFDIHRQLIAELHKLVDNFPGTIDFKK